MPKYRELKTWYLFMIGSPLTSDDINTQKVYCPDSDDDGEAEEEDKDEENPKSKDCDQIAQIL